LQNNTAGTFGGGIAFTSSPAASLNVASGAISNNKVLLNSTAELASVHGSAADHFSTLVFVTCRIATS